MSEPKAKTGRAAGRRPARPNRKPPPSSSRDDSKESGRSGSGKSSRAGSRRDLRSDSGSKRTPRSGVSARRRLRAAPRAGGGTGRRVSREENVLPSLKKILDSEKLEDNTDVQRVVHRLNRSLVQIPGLEAVLDQAEKMADMNTALDDMHSQLSTKQKQFERRQTQLNHLQQEIERVDKIIKDTQSEISKADRSLTSQTDAPASGTVQSRIQSFENRTINRSPRSRARRRQNGLDRVTGRAQLNLPRGRKNHGRKHSISKTPGPAARWQARRETGESNRNQGRKFRQRAPANRSPRSSLEDENPTMSIEHSSRESISAGTSDRRNSLVSSAASVPTQTSDQANPLIILRKPRELRGEDEIAILGEYLASRGVDSNGWWTDAKAKEMARRATSLRKLRGEYIFQQGDTAKEFFMILEGTVLVEVTENGRTAPCGSMDSGHIFGELALEDNTYRTATCQANTDAEFAVWDQSVYDELIRPIAVARTQASKLRANKDGKMHPEGILIKKAALFLDDAMNSRELKLHRNGDWPTRVNALLVSSYFQAFLFLCGLAWMFLLTQEPSSFLDSPFYTNLLQLLAIEWVLWWIFFIEALLVFYSYGKSWFFQHNLHVSRVVLLTIVFIDLCVASAHKNQSFRFSRVLRPCFVLLQTRTLRQVYYVAFSCIPRVMEILVVFLVLLAIFSRMAVHLFTFNANIYDQDAFCHGRAPYKELIDRTTGQSSCTMSNAIIQEAGRASAACPCFIDTSAFQSFGGFGQAMLSLYVLLSTENYPDVFWPAYNAEHFYFTFFGVFIAIGTFFMMNLLTAAIYDAYHRVMENLSREEEIREQQALSAAWTCLDEYERQFITKDRFTKLMNIVKKDYEEYQINTLFKLLDPDNNGLIDQVDFMTMIVDTLYLSIKKEEKSENTDLLRQIQFYLPTNVGSFARGEQWDTMVFLIRIIDIIALLFFHEAPSAFTVIDIFCVVVMIITTCTEFLFRYGANFKWFWAEQTNRYNLIILIVHTLGSFSSVGNVTSIVGSLRFIGLGRIIQVVYFGMQKLHYGSPSRALTLTIAHMIPLFIGLVFAYMVVCIYMFDVIGMELFHGTPGPPSHRCSGAALIFEDPFASFCDWSAAFVTLIQFTTTNNWHELMYAGIEKVGWVTSVYFVVFYFIGPVVMISLLFAVFFSVFFGAGVGGNVEQSLDDFLDEEPHAVELEDRPWTKDRYARELRDNMETVNALLDDGYHEGLFSGSACVAYLLETGLKDNEEDAVDLLSEIMDDGAFINVLQTEDAGYDARQFMKTQEAVYHWNDEYFSVDYIGDEELQNMNRIIIGLENSLGRWQRTIKRTVADQKKGGGGQAFSPPAEPMPHAYSKSATHLLPEGFEPQDNGQIVDSPRTKLKKSQSGHDSFFAGNEFTDTVIALKHEKQPSTQDGALARSNSAGVSGRNRGISAIKRQNTISNLIAGNV